MPRPREILESLGRAAIAAAGPEAALERCLRLDGSRLWAGDAAYDLDACKRVVLLGAGKAAAHRAARAEELLGDRLDPHGLVVVKHGHGVPLRSARVLEAGHPVPDAAGAEAAEALLQAARELGPDDLALVLLTGGASALLPAPAPGVSLADKQETTRLLLASGATIHQVNAVRKHLSRLKGGGLARALAPARTHALIVSDVVGDRLDVIASGPTAPDPDTCAHALAVLDAFALRHRVPASVRRTLERCAETGDNETVKPGDPCLERVRNTVCAGNAQAVDAAADAAREQGFAPLVLTTLLQGEAREAARVLAAMAAECVRSGRPLAAPCCLLAGGETTVTLRGDGTGGRNQELALAAALALAEAGEHVAARVAVMSLGTDGTDGPTDAAGAILLPGDLERARALGMDPAEHLRRNDAHPLLESLGALVRTGPTGTNVMDVAALLVLP
jgi:hydroxypyruvate reductase